jgi:type IX secretion system PorP/SprF family membrane protein
MLVAGWVNGQQYPLFTNYVLNNFGYNPAVAGSNPWFDGRLIYRTQWVGLEDAPMTQVVSLHGPIKKLGIGGYFFNDEAGKLRRTGGTAAVSYAFNLDSLGKKSIRLGLSGGYYNFRLKTDDLGSIDPAIAENASGQWTPDFNAGIYLQLNGFYAGISAPQIIKQQLTFSDSTDVNNANTQPHYFGMIGIKKPLGEKLALEPSILIKYFNNTPIQFDINLRAWFNNKFWVGGGYRYQDAAVGMVGYELSRVLSVAYAYDYTLSAIKDASSGSHEFVLGFKIGAPRDRDGDGVPDDEDDCPDEPGPKENKGCPENPLAARSMGTDTDLDGTPDEFDKCPYVPGPKENQGCPFTDRDNDGIRDDLDKCPDVFGYAYNEGCPINDRDRDGVVDDKDKCPDEPGPIANQGCPELDSDGDGVADIYDNCPKTPGDKDNSGCPIATAAEREILELAEQNVYFDTDKSDIKPESFRYLDKLAELMVKRHDWKVSMKGHADNRGSDEYNLGLSKRRAEAVMYYLMNRGTKRNQLIVEYFGESVPAASNASEGTRFLNRRVEMKFVWD